MVEYPIKKKISNFKYWVFPKKIMYTCVKYTKTEAIMAYNSLKNCHDMIDSEDCIDCYSCIECFDCVNVKNSVKIKNSKNCSNCGRLDTCENCVLCFNLNFEKNKKNVFYNFMNLN